MVRLIAGMKLSYLGLCSRLFEKHLEVYRLHEES
jgi:hypothetical protein